MLSIRWKLIFSYVVLSVVTAALVGVISFALIRSYVTRQAEEQLKLTAESIERQLRPHLRDRETAQLQVLADILSVVNNLRIRTLDGRQRLLTDTHPEGIAGGRNIAEVFELFDAVREYPPMMLRSPMNSRMPPPEMGRFGGGRSADTGLPTFAAIDGRVLRLRVQENGGLLGFIELQHPPDLAEQTLSRSRLYLAFAGLAAVAAAVGLGLAMGRRITNPLMSVSSAVRQIEAGNLTVRADVRRSDEIGELATNVNHMADTIESQIDALRKERDSLKAFAENASHELKTPVTALRTFNELLLGKRGDDVESRHEFLIDSQKQLDRLQWIVQALVKMTRLDSAVSELVYEKTDLPELILEVVSGRRGRIEAKHISIDTAENLPRRPILCDRNSIVTALGNIVDNAVTYSPKNGTIRIYAKILGNEIQVGISDEGPGVPDEDLPHIFKRFYRSRQAAGDGSGLGLALAESIVRAHGGRIAATSSPGGGVKLLVTLPINPAQSKPGSP